MGNNNSINFGSGSKKKLNLDNYINKKILDDGRIKVYLHNHHESYCVLKCGDPNCCHGALGTRWPGDEYFCYTDSDGYIKKK